jgi:two-component system sensor histidine kinase BaeS
MLHPDVSPAAKSISRRLFMLVFRALAGMLVAMVALMIIAAWVILGWANTSPENIEPLLVYMLESHYQARGSWDGVESVFAQSSSAMVNIYRRRWDDTILLDVNGRVVIDGGSTQSPLVHQVYTISSDQLHLPLKVNDQVVGELVFANRKILEPLLVFIPIIGPFSVLSLSLVVLALIISLLLVRRVVSPLAGVIAAAQSVTRGNFSARVKSSGPSDLRVLIESFNQMAESLESNDRERREMFAIIAHELRTPLSVLRGRLEGIVDGVYPADDAHIAGALEETYLLERLVEDLRLLALAEARQLHFDLKQVDLAALGRRAVELFEAEASERNIQLSFTAGGEIPPLEVDPQRMEQAIGNLIGNALRYIPNGGQVNISIQYLTEGEIGIVVSDNGPGVPEADLPHIFDRFWRGETSRTRLAGGSGLGLAIAKELVEAQGGRIAARNLDAGGLEVTIAFPVTKK